MSVADNTKHFQKGDIIFETNAPATHIYVLERVSWEQNTVTIRLLRSVQSSRVSPSESALLIGEKRSATISRESDVSVQSFDADQIKGMFKKWSVGNSCVSAFSSK